MNLLKNTFDLRDKSWIGAITNDGDFAECSLRGILLRAHELRAISDPIPTVECGVLRLLVALVLDIFAPRDTKDLAALIDAGQFNGEKINSYFELHQERFDLFHPRWPFLQTPMESEAKKPLAGLLCLIPSGTNALHFHHSDENDLAVSPAAAARLLTTIAPFMTAGGAGLPPSINGAPPFYVLLQGDTLFETILLNCPADQGLLPQAKRAGDLPLWKREEPITAKDQREAGVLQSLTWAARRIQLIPRAGGICGLTGVEAPVLVGAMRFAPGWSSRFEGWTDPHVPYRVTADKVTVLRPQENRPLWRDAGPLALLRQADYQAPAGQKFRFDRPAIVSQFAAMIQRHELPPEQELRLDIYAMRTDLKMKVFEWYRSTLRLPLPLVLNGDFASRAQSEIDKADLVAYHIGRAIKRVYPREGAGNKAAFDALIARAQRIFWDALEPLYLSAKNSLLEDLASLRDATEAERDARIKVWRRNMARIGEETLIAAIKDLDADADALERQVAARNLFAFHVRNILDPESVEKKKATAKSKVTKSKAEKGVVHV